MALATALFSGLANFINQFTVKYVGDPLVFTTIKNSLVVFLIVGLIIFLKKFPKIKQLSKKDLGLLVAIGIIGGSLPFYLFFTALAQMPAINAALIHKTLIFWVALLALPILGEKLSMTQMVALVVIFGANLVVGGFKGFSINRPELLVLAATLLWAIENVIAKITLRRVDPDIVTASRMGIGSAILLMAVIAFGKGQMLFALKPDQLGLTFLATLILFGYVSTWYRALSLAPIVTVVTVLTLATLVTNMLSAVFITHSFTFTQLAQLGLMTSGVLLFFTGYKRISRERKLDHQRALT